MTSWSLVLYSLLIILAAYIVKQLLSKEDNLVKFQSKFFIYFFFTSVVALFAIPAFSFNPRSVKNSLFISSILKRVTWFMGIKWSLRNGHILAEDRGCVIVANHHSIIDVLGMFNIWDVMKKCATISKREVFYVWPFGLAAYLGGVIFIDRRNPQESYRTLDYAKDLMIQQKTKIWLFPEGTRNTRLRGMLPFKRGAFKIAIEAKVPIIPVVYSPYYFINYQKYFFGNGKMIITCLDPIETKDLSLKDINDLIERTRNAMLDCYNDICKEVLSPLPADYPLAETY